MTLITRRAALTTGGGTAALALSGCSKIFSADALTQNRSVQHVLAAAEGWTLASQRFLLAGGALAPEYAAADVSHVFKVNGTSRPSGEDYAAAARQDFAAWRFKVDGLVARPLDLSLADLRRLPARTQITRHDCVEGWSAIGGWTGPQLGMILRAAGPSPAARYAVFSCADNLDGEPAKGGEQTPGQYYESLALVDAFHPQTLIAHSLNGRSLDVGHGAPLRLRVERQLGYKQAKYLTKVTLTATLNGIAGGRGGYWEDRGYDWYAGI